MRIDLRRRRRGSIAIEAVLIVPFAIMMVLLTRFILEAMLTRTEVAVFTRGATTSAAVIGSVDPLSCNFDRTGLGGRAGVSQSALALCQFRDGEAGLGAERPFFAALRDGAQPWRPIIDDFSQFNRVDDVRASGLGSMAFQRPDFLQLRGPQAMQKTYQMPTDEFWDHADKPWRTGHDRAIWQELSRKKVHKLFPNVFPARNG